MLLLLVIIPVREVTGQTGALRWCEITCPLRTHSAVTWHIEDIYEDISITYNPLRMKIGLLSCHHYQRCVKSVYLKIRKGKNEQTLSFLDPEVKGYTPPRGGTRQGWSRFPSYLPICPTGVLEGGGLTNFRVTHVCQRPGRFTRDWHLGCRSSCEVKAFLHLRQTEWSLPLASVLVWKTLMSNRD